MGIIKRFASENYVAEQISFVETKQTTLEEDITKLSEEIVNLRTEIGLEITEVASLLGGDA